MAASAIRYWVSRFMHVFHQLPLVSRVFLSVSFTFALAILTLRVIFFFTKPQGRAPSSPSPKREPSRRRHIKSNSILCSTNNRWCDFEPRFHLSRSLLVLVVLTCLSQSLGLQTLDQISVLPTELGRKITQSDVGTIRSIVQYLSLLLTSVWSHDKHQEQPYASP